MLEALSFTLSARPSTITDAPGVTAPMRTVQMGDTLFLVTADGPDAAMLLEAFDPLNIEALRDRIGALLQRGHFILADMAEHEAAAAS